MSKKKIVFRRDATGLIREIGTMDALVIVFSFVIGGGIMFLSVQSLSPDLFMGANLVLSYVGALFLLLPIFLVYTILARAMPRSGGDYVFNSRIVGPAWGFLASWGLWIGNLLIIGVLAFQTVLFLSYAVFLYGQSTWNLELVLGAINLSNPTNTVVFGIIVVLILGSFVMMGTRISTWAMRLLFIFPLIGTGIMVWLFSTHSPLDMWWAWNTVFGWGVDAYGAYFDIFRVATMWGWHINSALASNNVAWDTFGAMIAALFAFTGCETITIVSGEIKAPHRTLFITIIIGAVIVAVFYSLILYPMQSNYGAFISAYVYITSDIFTQLSSWTMGMMGPLAMLSPSTLQYWIQNLITVPPNIPLFGAPLAGLNLVAVFIALTGALWLLNYIIPAIFTTSRYVFAWSFDRIFPTKISYLSERTNTPIYAVGLSLLIAVEGVLMSYFSVFQAAINTVFLGVVSYGVVVISGLLFTRRRKDLAEITYNPKIGKISLVTLAAVFGILALIPVIIAGLTTFELSSLLLVLGVYLFGAVIYLVMRRRARKEGIDLDTIFKEIPPE